MLHPRDAVHAARQDTLDHAFRENRARFVNKRPNPPDKPTAAWIDPPQTKLTHLIHRIYPTYV